MIKQQSWARSLVFLAASVLSMLLIAACSGSDDNGDDSGSGLSQATATVASDADPTEPSGDQITENVTACDVVSKDEAAALLGEDVDDAETGVAACVYSASSQDSFASVGVGLFSYEVEGAAGSSFASGKDLVDSPEDVSGLGDEAYWDPSSGSLDIRQGRHFVSISIAFSDGSFFTPAAKQAAFDLAPTILERLP
jgi:hypothetical protein